VAVLAARLPHDGDEVPIDDRDLDTTPDGCRKDYTQLVGVAGRLDAGVHGAGESKKSRHRGFVPGRHGGTVAGEPAAEAPGQSKTRTLMVLRRPADVLAMSPHAEDPAQDAEQSLTVDVGDGGVVRFTRASDGQVTAKFTGVPDDWRHEAMAEARAVAEREGFLRPPPLPAESPRRIPEEQARNDANWALLLSVAAVAGGRWIVPLVLAAAYAGLATRSGQAVSGYPTRFRVRAASILTTVASVGWIGLAFWFYTR